MVCRAIDFFMAQDYAYRELLIVGDERSDIPDFTPIDGIDAIVSKRVMNIGEKRNWACHAARGQIVLHWDDDDFSAPHRISQQVEELDITKKSVTGYRAMKFTDGTNWWEFSIGRGFVLGTSLAYSWHWWVNHQFLPLAIGEDAAFCAAAAEANQLAEIPDLNLMYATIHERNTSKRRMDQDSGWVELPGFKWPSV